MYTSGNEKKNTHIFHTSRICRWALYYLFGWSSVPIVILHRHTNNAECLKQSRNKEESEEKCRTTACSFDEKTKIPTTKRRGILSTFDSNTKRTNEPTTIEQYCNCCGIWKYCCRIEDEISEREQQISYVSWSYGNFVDSHIKCYYTFRIVWHTLQTKPRFDRVAMFHQISSSIWLTQFEEIHRIKQLILFGEELEVGSRMRKHFLILNINFSVQIHVNVYRQSYHIFFISMFNG